MSEYVRPPVFGPLVAAIFLTLTAAFAVAMAATGRPGICSQYSAYATARTDFAQAATAIAAHDIDKADAMLKRGLDRLGYDYLGHSTSIQDDTGLHLSLAHYHELHGDRAKAVYVQSAVLGDRLQLFHYTHACED
jgi:hypothetical protein